MRSAIGTGSPWTRWRCRRGPPAGGEADGADAGAKGF